MAGKVRPTSALDNHHSSKLNELPIRPRSALEKSAVLSNEVPKTTLRPESAKQIKMPIRPSHSLGLKRDGGKNSFESKSVAPRPSSALMVRPSLSKTGEMHFVPDTKSSIRPSSALGRLEALPLWTRKESNQKEMLSRRHGASVGLREDAASGLEKQNLLSRVKEIVNQHSFGSAAVTKIPEKLDEAQPESDSDNAEEFETLVISKVRQVFDLRPSEMARLNRRFPTFGLVKAEFEQVMKEFTGMDLEMSSQLFCEIDANDDGSISWDEFLSYIVQVSNTFPLSHAIRILD
jgi:hypothetical protein